MFFSILGVAHFSYLTSHNYTATNKQNEQPGGFLTNEAIEVSLTPGFSCFVLMAQLAR